MFFTVACADEGVNPMYLNIAKNKCIANCSLQWHVQMKGLIPCTLVSFFTIQQIVSLLLHYFFPYDSYHFIRPFLSSYLNLYCFPHSIQFSTLYQVVTHILHHHYDISHKKHCTAGISSCPLVWQFQTSFKTIHASS